MFLTVGRTPRTGDQPAARPLPTLDNTNTEQRPKTSMPRVVFEPTISVFERVKAATVFVRQYHTSILLQNIHVSKCHWFKIARWLHVNVNSGLRRSYRADVEKVADISKVLYMLPPFSGLKMEEACTSETSETMLIFET
jgi:hypothetical protein